MSVRNGLALLLAFFAVTFLIACGSSSPRAVPPPGGGFSASNLNGTYVFSTVGVDVAGFYLAIAGAFTANGSGGITGGAFDLISPDPAVLVSPNVAITSSSYRITADGRGQATLNSSIGAIGLDFVLTSSSHGLVTEFDGNGTGSGTIDLQSSAISQSAITALSFGLSGSGSGPSYAPYAAVGSVTLSASGGVTSGVEDSNNSGTPATGQTIATTSSVAIGSGTAPGTATLTTNTTYSFDVYAVDNTHLKFIETDGLLFLSGDAYTPATSIPSGTLAFSMSGFDVTFNPLSVAGFLPTSSGAITAGLEDYNDGGNLNQAATVGGSFSAISAGRSVLGLTNFVNGAASDVPGSYSFAAYPFTSNGVTGILLLEIDGLGGITSGAAYLQTSTSLAAAQGYGFNLSAVNLGNGSGLFEEDDIAEFQTTSNNFNGIADLNDQGTLSFDKGLNGGYTVDSTGRGVVTNSNLFNFNFYVVNGSTVLVLETDSNQIGTGIFELQNASGSPGAQPGISMLRQGAQAHAAGRHK